MAKRTSAAEEAILLASASPEVCASLKQRAVAAAAQIWPSVGETVEAELLKRGDRLIDLTLAEYCLFPETARELFHSDPQDWAIRSLVLGNEALVAQAMPMSLMGGEEGLLTFLRRCTR